MLPEGSTVHSVFSAVHFSLRFLARFFLPVLAAALLAACGFQLRGAYTLPYESLYIAVPDYAVIGAGLKRAIRNTSTRIAESVEDAQASFQPAGESRTSTILALSSAGRVREKRLVYLYNYRVVDRKGRNLVLPVSVELFRDITYADSAVLAKAQEEGILWQDMENDLVQQVMRRLSMTRPDWPEDHAQAQAGNTNGIGQARAAGNIGK